MYKSKIGCQITDRRNKQVQPRTVVAYYSVHLAVVAYDCVYTWVVTGVSVSVSWWTKTVSSARYGRRHIAEYAVS
jgi:hypothetical protein